MHHIVLTNTTPMTSTVLEVVSLYVFHNIMTEIGLLKIDAKGNLDRMFSCYLFCNAVLLLKWPWFNDRMNTAVSLTSIIFQGTSKRQVLSRCCSLQLLGEFSKNTDGRPGFEKRRGIFVLIYYPFPKLARIKLYPSLKIHNLQCSSKNSCREVSPAE